MKKVEVNGLPAGSVVLAKTYNLWDRFKAFVCKKNLPYNDGWIDPTGGNKFLYEDTLWTKHNVFVFTPKKQYSKKEIVKLFEIVLPAILTCKEPVEGLLAINLVRPDTLKGNTLEELFDNNKYYNKKEIK